MPVEELAEQRAALLCEHSGHDLGTVVEPSVTHMVHGSRVTMSVQPLSRQLPIADAAARRALTSAWPVGSPYRLQPNRDTPSRSEMSARAPRHERAAAYASTYAKVIGKVIAPTPG